ncbi:MAG TPA: OmpA family protein [Polyangiaceae bacterium]|nr:OmpA family protein [Polyangiaceae bacterium]
MSAQFAAIAAVSLAALACSSTQTTPELVNARQAYDRATRAHAAEYTPASVLGAHQALARAERVHDDDPGSDREKSYAYVAQRRAELAIVDGDAAYNRTQKHRAELEYARLQEEMGERTRAQLEVTQDQLERQTEQAQTARAETDRERKARLQAEGRAERALDSLQQIAQVKEEARGMVITLSGQVLFVTGKAELLPAARDALSAVARAILDSGDEQPITIEGHTDSRGNEEQNLQLSKQRAEVVRDYLITQGLDRERVTAVGYGESRPMASNDSAEGRANNRRVEVVVGKQPAGPPAGMTPASGTR